MQYTPSADLAGPFFPSGLGQSSLVVIILLLFAGIILAFFVDAVSTKKVSMVPKTSLFVWIFTIISLTAILYFATCLNQLSSQGWQLSNFSKALVYISRKICPSAWLVSLVFIGFKICENSCRKK